MTEGVRCCVAVGKPAGFLAQGETEARRFTEKRSTFVVFGSDSALLPPRRAGALRAKYHGAGQR